MNILIASSIAYTLPRGLSYAYNRLCVNQNLEQENNPHLIVDSIPHTIKTFFGFLLASAYDSVWIAIPLFSILATPCGALMGIAAILGLSVVIEIIREWVECFFAPGNQTPFPFRTSYPVKNIFTRITLKALMLLPALFLAWLPPYMTGRLILWVVFSGRASIEPSGLVMGLGVLVIIAGWITHFLLKDFCRYLHLGFSIENYFERVTDTLDPNARCHILQAPMTDPVRLYRCGHLFERKALIEWIRLPGAERPCPSCQERIWTKGEREAERSEGERVRAARRRAAEEIARERSAMIEKAREAQAKREEAARDDIERVRGIVTRAG